MRQNILLIIEWVTIAVLTIVPFVALFVRFINRNKESDSSFDIFLMVLLPFMIFTLARFENITIDLEKVVIPGYTRKEMVWQEPENGDPFQKEEDVFIITNKSYEWVEDVLSIYVFYLLLGAPYLTVTLVNKEKKDTERKSKYARYI